MIPRRLNLIALAIIVSLAWTGCRRPVPTPVANPESRPAVQKRGSTKAVFVKADEDFVRVRLLLADAVQKDLGLTPDQRVKLTDFVKLCRERSREFAAKWPDFLASGVTMQMSQPRFREFQASLKDWQSNQKELTVRLLRMLTQSQRKRLDQIELQQRIAAVLTRPDFIKALAISDEQLAKIRPLSRARVDERLLAQSRRLNGLPREERRKKSIELSKEWDEAQAAANKRALDVLAPQQRSKLEKFVGKEIEVKWDYEALAPDNGLF